jgi:hypothetical protein
MNTEKGQTTGDKSAKHRAGFHKQLRKTKFCMYHLQGACRFGEECAFAHTLVEVHNTPDLRKTQLCKNFAEGVCKDPNCDFAHGEFELRSTDLFFRKTLCIWNEKGKCRNGSTCRFAHGIKELRSDLPPNGQGAYDVENAEKNLPLKAKQVASGKVGKPQNSNKGEKDKESMFAALSQLTGDEPIKVFPCGGSALPQLPPVLPEFIMDTHFGPSAGDSLLTAARRAAQLQQQQQQQQSAIQQADLLALQQALAGGVLPNASLQMDLEALRTSVAVLTSHFSRLQERIDLGNGHDSPDAHPGYQNAMKVAVPPMWPSY